MSELGVDMDACFQDHPRAGARFTVVDRAATFQLTEYTRGSSLPLAAPQRREISTVGRSA